MNLLNFFEGCNEGIMGKETERRGSTVKWREAPLQGIGVCENPERFSLNDGLNYWVLSQDCRNTLPWHTLLNF